MERVARYSCEHTRKENRERGEGEEKERTSRLNNTYTWWFTMYLEERCEK